MKTCFITCHRGCLVVSPVLPFPRPIVCFTFWQEGNAVGLPIIYSAGESSSAYRPFFTLPTIRQGSPHPGGLGGEGAPPLAVVWVVLGLLSWTVCSGTTLCHPKTNHRFFSCSFGKPRTSSINYMPASYEVSRSGIGSREGRQFGFCFPAVTFWDCVELLLEQECI